MNGPRPLTLTVDCEDVAEGKGFVAWFVLKLNGREIHRAEAFYGADSDDAELWVADVLIDFINGRREP